MFQNNFHLWWDNYKPSERPTLGKKIWSSNPLLQLLLYPSLWWNEDQHKEPLIDKKKDHLDEQSSPKASPHQAQVKYRKIRGK